jgi:hypothetical protein
MLVITDTYIKCTDLYGPKHGGGGGGVGGGWRGNKIKLNPTRRILYILISLRHTLFLYKVLTEYCSGHVVLYRHGITV